MHILVVSGRPQTVTQAGLHASLGGRRVGALGWHQADYDYLLAAAARAYCCTLACQAAADDEYVGVDYLH